MNKFDHGRPEVVSIDTLITRMKNDKIDLKAPYQREIVWTDEDKSRFINSCYYGMTPTIIIFSTDTETGKYICIDGKQRLTSIYQFVNNMIPLFLDNITLWWDKEPIDSPYPNNDIFTIKERTKFERRKLFSMDYEDLEYNEQADLFNRIQYGKSLKEGEKKASLFTDRDICVMFKKFCESKKDILGQYAGNIDRKEHHVKINKLLVMLTKNELKISTNKSDDKYLKSIESKSKMEKILEDVGKKIDFCFSKRLITSNKVPKMNMNIFYTAIYFLVTQFPDYEITELEEKAFRTGLRIAMKRLKKETKIGNKKTKNNLEQIYSYIVKWYNIVLNKDKKRLIKSLKKISRKDKLRNESNIESQENKYEQSDEESSKNQVLKKLNDLKARLRKKRIIQRRNIRRH